jgi:hypothetical protein
MPDPSDLEWTELERLQASLFAIAHEVRALVRSRSLDGFAGISVDQRAGTVTVYWTDPVPEAIAKLAAGTHGARILIKAATYSRDELEARARLLLPVTGRCDDVHTVDVRTDGSGLVVYLDPESTDQRIAELETDPLVLRVIREADTGEPLGR